MTEFIETRVVFIGDAEQVASFLHRSPGIDLVAAVLESDSVHSGAWDEFLRSGISPIYRVSDSTDLLAILDEVGSFDIGICANFGLILKSDVLSKSKLGWFNCHPGKLPQYKGRQPIGMALEAGEQNLTMTIHRMTPAIDSGEIIAEQSIPVMPQTAYKDLTQSLYKTAAYMLENSVFPILQKTPQIAPLSA